MKVTEYIADFDSSAAMVRAVGRFLRGKGFPMLGTMPVSIPPYTWVNWFPQWVREKIYIFGGWIEAIRPEQLLQVDSDQMARWVVDLYPRRRFPAIAIGSSNGAGVHLWAALGAPWLPQTFLIPVRHPGIHPDEPRYALEAFREHGRVLLERNPDLQLHHMHDPNQDQLMIQIMGYFRTKWLRLPSAYRQFIVENLEPGGTIFIVDCQLKWPTRKVADRHFFQHGALGGATVEEYHQGSARVEEFLRRHGSHRRRWDPPDPDAHRPEAEWGFEPAMLADIEELAARRGYRLRRVVFTQPEDFSPLVADLYRWWYEQRSIPTNRLLVESFVLMEPWWTLRTGCIPFWMVFNTEASARALASYLESPRPFDFIHLMLFSHGAESIGLVPIEHWRALLRKARRLGSFMGVDPRAYPKDFAAFVNYHRELKKKVRARYPMPAVLPLETLDKFLTTTAEKYRVQWQQRPSLDSIAA